MAENIVEAIRQQLGMGPVKKIDPNKQAVSQDEGEAPYDKLAQAAIPAVVVAFAVFAKTDRGADILLGHGSLKYIDLFLGKHEQIAAAIATYAGVSEEEAAQTMEKITQAAAAITVNAAAPDPTVEKVRNYLAGQRHKILSHLLPSLKLGEVLNDNSLDDRTNKMEGPMSNIAHTIENFLSGSGEPKS